MVRELMESRDSEFVKTSSYSLICGLLTPVRHDTDTGRECVQASILLVFGGFPVLITRLKK